MDKLSERLAVVSCIDPDAYAAGTVTGDAIDMSKFHRIVAIVQVGDLGASATVDYSLTGSTTSGGSYTTISGKSITQLTQAGTDDNKQAIIELTGADAKVAGIQFVKDKLVVGGTDSDAGAIVLADRARYAPASDNDLSSVD